MTIEDLYKDEPPETKEEDKPKAENGGFDYSEAWNKEYPKP